ncbi:MAG: hypothetical protein ACYDA6_07440 [Solirubrobacteraceae bacterium]
MTTALAMGWQMARLYTGPLRSAAEPEPDEDLPGLSALTPASLVELGLMQADNALARLRTFLPEGTSLPDTATVRAAAEEKDADDDAPRASILDLHVALLVDLTAADYRLGKAYGLGRALADTCSSVRGEDSKHREALEHHLEPHRALVLVGWLDDLKTVLPAHSGQAVADSFQRWVRWAEATDLSTFDSHSITQATRGLHRAGQRWRAVLSGEKRPQDVLEISDYVDAARGALARAGAITRSFVWQMKWPLAAAAGLIGVGIALMFINNSTAQVLAGLGTVAGGLGITWRSAAASLGRVSLDLGRPLWEAQIDVVVGAALTQEPQREYVAQRLSRQRRLARAWRDLRSP